MFTRVKNDLDAYLLRVLYTVLEEKSVTRAALKLGQSQPSISNSLKRLRDITGDAILVRGKAGLVPTVRGEELLALAKQGLEAMDKIAIQPKAFDPASIERVFQIGAPDYLDVFFIPNIIERLRKKAPNAKLAVHSLNAGFDYTAALESGSMDIVIGNWPQPPNHLHLSPLFEDEVVCMVSRENPCIKRAMSLELYLRMPHLAPTPYVAAHCSLIDTQLAEQGLKRNICMTIPYFGLVPHVLMKTDLVFTTGHKLAHYYAEKWPIEILRIPFDCPKMRFYMLWHERCHSSPEIIWLRRLIGDVAQDINARK